jgi:ABC-type multidrug transport system fused ATPase/permease subunit
MKALHQDANFTVEPGRILGFLGPNGAGKTTAMRAIFGLVRLDAGHVTWNGRPIDLEYLLRFGYMPEERGLYPKMKVGDQLRYFARLHGLSASAATSATNFWLSEFGIGPDGLQRVAEIATLLPPVAPFTMSSKMILGTAEFWEIAVSLALIFVSIYGMIRLAARLFQGSVLQTGMRVRWRDAWRRGSSERGL